MIPDERRYIKDILDAMEGSAKNPDVDPYIPRFPAAFFDKNTGKVRSINKSGLSYGRMQNDVSAGDYNVKKTFRSILAAHPVLKQNDGLRQKAFDRAEHTTKRVPKE